MRIQNYSCVNVVRAEKKHDSNTDKNAQRKTRQRDSSATALEEICPLSLHHTVVMPSVDMKTLATRDEALRHVLG